VISYYSNTTSNNHAIGNCYAVRSSNYATEHDKVVATVERDRALDQDKV